MSSCGTGQWLQRGGSHCSERVKHLREQHREVKITDLKLQRGPARHSQLFRLEHGFGISLATYSCSQGEGAALSVWETGNCPRDLPAELPRDIRNQNTNPLQAVLLLSPSRAVLSRHCHQQDCWWLPYGYRHRKPNSHQKLKPDCQTAPGNHSCQQWNKVFLVGFLVSLLPVLGLQSKIWVAAGCD